MATGVHQAVMDNVTRTRNQGTEKWADLLRTTIPEGLVRDAILASPAWPDIATTMGHLHDQGVDVARILTDAHAAGLGVDQAVAATTTAPPGRRRTGRRTGRRGCAVVVPDGRTSCRSAWCSPCCSGHRHHPTRLRPGEGAGRSVESGRHGFQGLVGFAD
ncbi:hypothetical protein ACIRJR_33120 [Streptomyces sp. NPDC102402]|uniref:hypothetical protein n=1 Tax=Streptomyces sp. NPDC102402 TaxID=3366169 RepID=UPI00381A3884